MNLKVLPTKSKAGPVPRRSRHSRARGTLFQTKPRQSPSKTEEWDTRGMIRTLASRYPNLDPRLLGWTLLACKLKLEPDDPPELALENADQLIRSDLFDAAARMRARLGGDPR